MTTPHHVTETVAIPSGTLATTVELRADGEIMVCGYPDPTRGRDHDCLALGCERNEPPTRSRHVIARSRPRTPTIQP